MRTKQQDVRFVLFNSIFCTIHFFSFSFQRGGKKREKINRVRNLANKNRPIVIMDGAKRIFKNTNKQSKSYSIKLELKIVNFIQKYY